jgi:hypothetical protein
MIMKQITVKVKGGTLRAIASSDPAYPGIWVEFIPMIMLKMKQEVGQPF